MLIVEGYFDVVRLMAAGIEEVVAPLGTALTEAQAQLVTRYAQKVYLLYDADAPGQKAAFRSGDELLRQGAAVHVVSLPDGEDPDTYVAKHGADGLRVRLGEAADLFERKVQILERAGWFGDLAGKRRALDRLLPTIRATADPLMRDIYIARASEASGVSRELLAEEAKRVGSSRPGSAARARRDDAGDGSRETQRTSHTDGPPPGLNDAPPPDEPGFQEQFQRRPFRPRTGDRRRGWNNAPEERPSIRGWGRTSQPGALTERELLRALVHQRASVEAVAERISADGFRVEAYGRIFEALLHAGEDAPLDAVVARLDADTVRVLQDEVLVDPESIGDPTATIAQALNGLRIREIDDEMEAIERQRQLANDVEKDALNVRAKQLREEKRALGGKSFRTQGFRKRRA